MRNYARYAAARDRHGTAWSRTFVFEQEGDVLSLIHISEPTRPY